MDHSAHRVTHGFARHLVEMFAVMIAGMVAAAFVYMTIVNAFVAETTWEEALLGYPIPTLLVIAFGMSVPMAAWMRVRGHSRERSIEMALAMALPVVPFCVLAAAHVVEGAQCGLYCLASTAAMVALMVYRRSDYGGARTVVRRGA